MPVSERHPRFSNPSKRTAFGHIEAFHHGHHRSSTPDASHWRGSMGSESTLSTGSAIPNAVRTTET